MSAVSTISPLTPRRSIPAHVATTLILCTLLNGCAVSPPPAAEEIRKDALAHTPLPQAWKADQSVSSELVQDNWLHSFNDPTLDALVHEAILNNPDLRVAALRVEQSRVNVTLARSALRPSI